jgi:putative spermidine/putrescine transport system ATP-binding protein
MAFLTLTNIYKVFGKITAVNNFNLDVEKGEFISFLGPSGCGKTTTLRMIAGFETPTSGNIVINGTDITNTPPNQRNVGMVFQSYALFPNLTVADNIGFGLKIGKKPADEIKQRVKEMLELIHMPEFGNRYPYQLSGGQQQRVALARALAIQPQVLLLDEPLSALDAKIRLRLRTEIRTIQHQLGITTIYVTHDQEEALSLSDRVVVMSEGVIEQIGAPFDIYNFPKTQFVASFVGTLNVIQATVRDTHKGLVAIDNQEISIGKGLENYRAGDVIQLALRPEMVSLNAQTRLNHIKSEIEAITFLGSIVRTQAKITNTRLFYDTFNNPNLVMPAIGSQVDIYFPPEACLVLGVAPKESQHAQQEA